MRFIFLLAICFLGSCAGNKVPKGVLPPEKMEAILYDVIRADEMVDFYKLSDSTYRQFSKLGALYDTIFRLHGITKEDYKKSQQFYQGRPDLLKPILDSAYARTDSLAFKATSL